MTICTILKKNHTRLLNSLKYCVTYFNFLNTSSYILIAPLIHTQRLAIYRLSSHNFISRPKESSKSTPRGRKQREKVKRDREGGRERERETQTRMEEREKTRVCRRTRGL